MEKKLIMIFFSMTIFCSWKKETKKKKNATQNKKKIDFKIVVVVIKFIHHMDYPHP